MKKMFLSMVFFLLLNVVYSEDLSQLGWIESVVFEGRTISGKKEKISLNAKVDTGAKTSSLNAIYKKTITKMGQSWIQFSSTINGKVYELEAPLYKTDLVKTSDAEEGESRKFVTMDVCIGKKQIPIVVSLNDRSKMLYPALLGRAFLENRFLVNPAKKNLQELPACTF